MKKRFIFLLIFSLLATITVAPVNARTDFNKFRTEVVERTPQQQLKRTFHFLNPATSIPSGGNDVICGLSDIETHSVLVRLKLLRAFDPPLFALLHSHFFIIPSNDEVPLG
jgi:hypothetical protein